VAATLTLLIVCQTKAFILNQLISYMGPNLGHCEILEFFLSWDAFEFPILNKSFVTDTHVVPVNIRVQDAGGVVGA